MPRNMLFEPVPTVAPTGAPDDYQRIQASPEAFGMATAQGLANLGQGIEKVGETGLDILTARQHLTNEVHSSEVNTWLADKITDRHSTFSQLTGKAALDALPQYKTDIEKLYNDSMSQAVSPEEKAMLAKTGRYLTTRYYGYATQHASSQFRTWADKTAADRALTYGNVAITANNNDDINGMNIALNTSDDEIRKLYETKFYDPDAIAAEVSKNRGNNVKNLVETASINDVRKANAIFEKYKDGMDASNQRIVSNFLKTRLKQIEASDIVTQELVTASQFKGALSRYESGTNPTKVNPYGYAGTYQFGAPRLETIGVYTAGPGENLQTWSSSARNAPGKWTGTFSIPNFPEVKTFDDFLRNPKAQEAVFGMHQQKMDQEIVTNDLEKYIGQTVGGVPITREGLYAMLHLGGVGSTRIALESNGTIAKADANGTTVMDYARLGATATGTAPGLPDKGVVLQRIMERTQHDPELQAQAVSQFNRQYLAEQASITDQERQRKLYEQQRKDRSDQAEDLVIRDLFGPTPKITAQQIVNSNVLDRQAKERLVGIATRANKPDPLAEVSHRTTMDLMDRMRMPDGNPRRISDLNPITDAYINGKLNRADFEFASKQFRESRTPDGQRLTAAKTELLKAVAPSIDKSNPLMGKLDQDGKLNLYRYEWDLDQKISEYRKLGKDPHELFNPSNPDFMGSPAALKNYLKPLQESIRDQARKLGVPVTTTPAAPSLAPPTPVRPLRKPGETPAEYLKRVGIE